MLSKDYIKDINFFREEIAKVCDEMIYDPLVKEVIDEEGMDKNKIKNWLINASNSILKSCRKEIVMVKNNRHKKTNITYH